MSDINIDFSKMDNFIFDLMDLFEFMCGVLELERGATKIATHRMGDVVDGIIALLIKYGDGFIDLDIIDATNAVGRDRVQGKVDINKVRRLMMLVGLKSYQRSKANEPGSDVAQFANTFVKQFLYVLGYYDSSIRGVSREVPFSGVALGPLVPSATA